MYSGEFVRLYSHVTLKTISTLIKKREKITGKKQSSLESDIIAKYVVMVITIPRKSHNECSTLSYPCYYCLSYRASGLLSSPSLEVVAFPGKDHRSEKGKE